MTTDMNKIWKKFDSLFKKSSEIFDSIDTSDLKFEDGTHIKNTNGHLVIKGDFKSITINRRKIKNIKAYHNLADEDERRAQELKIRAQKWIDKAKELAKELDA